MAAQRTETPRLVVQCEALGFQAGHRYEGGLSFWGLAMVPRFSPQVLIAVEALAQSTQGSRGCFGPSLVPTPLVFSGMMVS